MLRETTRSTFLDKEKAAEAAADNMRSVIDIENNAYEKRLFDRVVDAI
jgi:hypothetical protein